MNTSSSVFLSDELQLGYALSAFARANDKPDGWATSNLLRLKAAGIVSMSDLSTGCKEETINLDLELFGTPASARLSEETINALRVFLPGPVGFRAFRLAQMAATKVDSGEADTEYVHRPESGKQGDESFRIKANDNWILNVDCAGFVRACLKHVTKDPFVMMLSDRDFMRAKDFYGYFASLTKTVLDPYTPGEEHLGRPREWRRVDDLRMAIPGDVICYRPRGSAAGGAAFTTNDRKDLTHLLRAIITAKLWAEEPQPCMRNMGKDSRVKAWVADTKKKLHSIDIRTVKNLYMGLDTVNKKLEDAGLAPLDQMFLNLAKECAETTCQNTGHIVFASGPAVHKGDGEFRIRVVHSTKYGKRDENGVVTTGVQEYFRRFQMVTDEETGKIRFTREMSKAKPAAFTVKAPVESAITDDEGENPDDDMEEDPSQEILPDGDEPTEEEAPDDELSGQAMVEVIIARMCF